MKSIIGAALLLAAAQSKPAPAAVRAVIAAGDSRVAAAKGSSIDDVLVEGVVSRTLSCAERGRVFALAPSPDHKHFAAAGGIPGKSAFLAVVELASFKITSSVAIDAKDCACAVSWSAAGVIAFGLADGRTMLFSAADPSRAPRVLAPHAGGVLAVAAGASLVATGSADRTIRVRALDSGDARCTLTDHAGAVNALALDPTETRLASGSDDGTVRVWDPATGRMIRILRGHEGAVLAVAWHDGRIYSAGADGTVRAFDPGEGTLVGTVCEFEGWGYGVAIVGDRICVATDRGLRTFKLPK